MMMFTMLQASTFLRCRNHRCIARWRLRGKNVFAPLVFSRDRHLKCLAKTIYVVICCHSLTLLS